MTTLVKLIAFLLKRLPVRIQNWLYEITLKNIPFWMLKRIPCSYSTYLKCYTPKKGDLVLDCGAHVGNCAIIFSRLVGKEGRVICIEPFKESCNELRDRLRHLKIRNVNIINKGIWSETLKQALIVSNNTISCKLSPDENKFSESQTHVEIECTTLDDLISELRLPQLDLIKMDIEGSEIEALKGAVNTLTTLKPHLAIASYHYRGQNQTFHAVEEFLIKNHYDVTTFFPPHLTTCARPE
jgi:FkbM family methyltransferase